MWVQAWYLEQLLREARSHPHVNGIVLWAPWAPQGCYRMCLTDNNFKNLPTGDVVDKLLREWGWKQGTTSFGVTDANGFLETALFHGDYHIKVSYSKLDQNSDLIQTTLSLGPTSDPVFLLRLSGWVVHIFGFVLCSKQLSIIFSHLN